MERFSGGMDKDNESAWRHGVVMRRHREQQNLTQKELADKVNASAPNSISEENIRDMEAGKKDVVSGEVLYKIYAALGIDGFDDVFQNMNLEKGAGNDNE